MRLGDAGDDVRARVVVHQRAAAAVDLNVDETRRENSAAEIDFAAAAGTLRVGRDAGDAGAVDDDGVVVEETLAVEDPRADQRRHQIVSVTLCRLRGWSGLRPRRRDTASARP